MAQRQLNDWITSYLEYTENSESPVSFHLWGGVSAIAAALQRKVYLKWGHSTIYPNQYIVLVGPSGQSRKGEAISIPRSLVESLKIPLLGEDNTQESIIVEMKNAVTSFVDKGNKRLTFQCAISCFVEELSVFTGQQNSTFLAYLTNWYDSRDTWKRTTKHQGTDEITGLCFNLLSATAPDWIPHIFPRETIGGGFTSRCIFVVEPGKSKIIADPNSCAPSPDLKRALLHDLEVIHTLSGEYRFSEKAKRLYMDWYIAEEEKIRDGKPSIADNMFSGYMSRRAMHLFKLSMAMTASHTNERTIAEKDFNRALAMLLKAERNMPKVFAGIGRARYVEETEMILQFLAARGHSTKSEILSRFYKQVDEFSLEAIMKVLNSMKAVKVVIQPGVDTKYVYTWSQEEPEGPTRH
jgi:hypothetical protein